MQRLTDKLLIVTAAMFLAVQVGAASYAAHTALTILGQTHLTLVTVANAPR